MIICHIEKQLKIKKMEELFKRKNSGITQIYKLIEDDVNSYMEEQNRMSESLNVNLKIAGNVEFFT